MRSDSPPPSWYEPDDSWDDDREPDPAVGELLTIAGGIVSWSAAHHDDGTTTAGGHYGRSDRRPPPTETDMELQAIIDRHRAAVAARAGDSALTPKGEATRLLYRLVAALGVLPDDDRRAVHALLAEELGDRPA